MADDDRRKMKLFDRLDTPKGKILSSGGGRRPVTASDLYRDFNNTLGMLFRAGLTFFNINVPGINAGEKKVKFDLGGKKKQAPKKKKKGGLFSGII